MSRKKLKSLKEHDNAVWKRRKEQNNPRLNGIECPKCGAELYDSNSQIILTSFPGKLNTHCTKCGYKGYRLT